MGPARVSYTKSVIDAASAWRLRIITGVRIYIFLSECLTFEYLVSEDARPEKMKQSKNGPSSRKLRVEKVS